VSVSLQDLLGSVLGGQSAGGGAPAGSVGGLAGGGGGGGGTGALIAALAPAVGSLLAGGGLSKILSGFQAKGFSSQADSWVSGGENKPISPTDVKQVLEPQEIAQVAQQANISEDQAAEVLAQAIPAAVDKATPDGTVPNPEEVDAALQLAPK
jgi:uncharacterized protein YidB (DUF937 family)